MDERDDRPEEGTQLLRNPRDRIPDRRRPELGLIRFCFISTPRTRPRAGFFHGRPVCAAVLQGILDELRKVGSLADYGYLQEKILAPALAVMRLKTVKSADLAPSMPELTDAQRTYQLRKLVDRKMLQSIHEGARPYSLSFTSGYLLRGVVMALGGQGFIRPALN